MSSIALTIPDKLRELRHLLALYETAIEQQQKLLDRTTKGKFKSTQIGDEILYALVKGDLNLLKNQKTKYQKDLESLEKQNIEEDRNGFDRRDYSDIYQ